MDVVLLEPVGGEPPVLRVGGEVDIASADALAAALAEALAAYSTVIVDMAGVTFIDASGLHVILQAASALNGRGPLTLVHAQRVARLLDLVGLAGTPSVKFGEEA